MEVSVIGFGRDCKAQQVEDEKFKGKRLEWIMVDLLCVCIVLLSVMMSVVCKMTYSPLSGDTSQECVYSYIHDSTYVLIRGKWHVPNDTD